MLLLPMAGLSSLIHTSSLAPLYSHLVELECKIGKKKHIQLTQAYLASSSP
jgi:hypothetical protein